MRCIVQSNFNDEQRENEMVIRSIFAITLILASVTTFSAVTITAPEEIKILAVNDQEVNTGLFRAKNNQYKVDAGKNNLSVRYNQYFEHLNGEHDIVKSGVITLTTPLLKDGESYALNLVNAPTNYETAKKYAEQPVIALFDQNKKILVQQTGANTQQKPWLSQSLFGKVTDLTQKKSIPLNQPAPVYSQTSVTESIEDRSISTTDQQLIQLWKKSSKIERQKFMNWLGEQSN
jgi:uncharacterized protein YccT (UPF0319 family)